MFPVSESYSAKYRLAYHLMQMCIGRVVAHRHLIGWLKHNATVYAGNSVRLEVLQSYQQISVKLWGDNKHETITKLMCTAVFD